MSDGGEEKIVETCSSFKLLKQGDLYFFSYYVKGSPVSFLATLVDVKEDITSYFAKQVYYDGKAI